jgi:hypothetical protein
MRLAAIRTADGAGGDGCGAAAGMIVVEEAAMALVMAAARQAGGCNAG